MMEKIEDVSLVLLLPLFFVFTGLRTEIGLLNNTSHWVTCILIVLTAVAGKFGGTTLASRIVGQSWKESLSLGALMNTRGLMELIVLNIGYDLGVLTPEVFAMLVLMALVTTFMTGPALDIINYFFAEKVVAEKGKFYKVLFAFGPAEKGKKLLRIADQLAHAGAPEASITAFHLTPSSDINPKEAKEYEQESFRLVRQEAESLAIKVKTVYRATNDINREITREANNGGYDLLLVGGSHSLFSHDVVGGKVKTLIEETRCHVGVLVDREFHSAGRLMVLLQDINDLFLLSFAERFIAHSQTHVVVADPHRLIKTNVTFSMAFAKINSQYPEQLHLHESYTLGIDRLPRFDLVLVSTSGWRDLRKTTNPWLTERQSFLILKPVGDSIAKADVKSV
jgi:hypothetical protein